MEMDLLLLHFGWFPSSFESKLHINFGDRIDSILKSTLPGFSLQQIREAA